MRRTGFPFTVQGEEEEKKEKKKIALISLFFSFFFFLALLTGVVGCSVSELPRIDTLVHLLSCSRTLSSTRGKMSQNDLVLSHSEFYFCYLSKVEDFVILSVCLSLASLLRILPCVRWSHIQK